MSKRSVYLAGPITGLSYDEARNGWRKEFYNKINPSIDCYSPMRYKSKEIKGEQKLEGTPDMYFDSLFSSAKGITCRDEFDVRKCDVIVANFLGAKKASLGTAIEFGWAHAIKTPIVMIIEDYDGDEEEDKGNPKNPHHHAMMFEMSGYVVHSVDDAVKVIEALLTPGV